MRTHGRRRQARIGDDGRGVAADIEEITAAAAEQRHGNVLVRRMDKESIFTEPTIKLKVFKLIGKQESGPFVRE